MLSDWFLAVTSFGSLFLVAGKRHGELVSGADAGTRPALAALHARAPAVPRHDDGRRDDRDATACGPSSTRARATIPWWGLSIVPFVVGIMRYGLLVDRGQGGAPEEIILRDPGMRLSARVWLVLFLGSVYVH